MNSHTEEEDTARLSWSSEDFSTVNFQSCVTNHDSLRTSSSLINSDAQLTEGTILFRSVWVAEDSSKWVVTTLSGPKWSSQLIIF